MERAAVAECVAWASGCFFVEDGVHAEERARAVDDVLARADNLGQEERDEEREREACGLCGAEEARERGDADEDGTGVGPVRGNDEQRDDQAERERERGEGVEQCALGALRPTDGKARAYCDHDGVLGDPAQDERREEGVDRAAEHAADADEEIEAGELIGWRARLREASVAGERDRGKRDQVQRDNDGKRMAGVDHERDCGCYGEHRHKTGQHSEQAGCARREGDDERDQVERERDDPEQRHRGDVGRDVLRHAEEQAARDEGENDPRDGASGVLGCVCAFSRDRHRAGCASDTDPDDEDREREHAEANGPEGALLREAERGLDE